MTENLVGGHEGISDAGLSLSRLFPSDAVYLEATGEIFRGESALFRAPRRQDFTYVGRLRAYRDLSESTNLDLGGSIASGHNEAAATTRLFGADLTLRYRPLRRALYRRFILRAEAVWSRTGLEEGQAKAFGAYVSAEYQFARRFFLGGRFDHSERADNPSLVDKGASAILTFWPSEFSQVRGQFRHTRYGEGETANEALVQLLFSIGAHGAHAF
jgi:hypothetical protein